MHLTYGVPMVIANSDEVAFYWCTHYSANIPVCVVNIAGMLFAEGLVKQVILKEKTMLLYTRL